MKQTKAENMGFTIKLITKEPKRKEGWLDGRKISNLEELKIKYFYPDIDYKDVKDASEIQFFKDLPLQPPEIAALGSLKFSLQLFASFEKLYQCL